MLKTRGSCSGSSCPPAQVAESQTPPRLSSWGRYWALEALAGAHTSLAGWHACAWPFCMHALVVWHACAGRLACMRWPFGMHAPVSLWC
jgi:hypothetical protein